MKRVDAATQNITFICGEDTKETKNGVGETKHCTNLLLQIGLR